jgi:hypothetical protein
MLSPTPHAGKSLSIIQVYRASVLTFCARGFHAQTNSLRYSSPSFLTSISSIRFDERSHYLVDLNGALASLDLDISNRYSSGNALTEVLPNSV